MSENGRIRSFLERARNARAALSRAPSWRKDEALSALSHLLRERRNEIEHENDADLLSAERAGVGEATIQRLRLDEGRLLALADEIGAVVRQADPVGEVIPLTERPDGLKVSRLRVPLGTVALVAQARPWLTVHAAALCMKSGNACLIRGGADVLRTNTKLMALIEEAVNAVGLPGGAVQLIADTSREGLYELLQADDAVNLIISRCEPELNEFVRRNSRVPVLDSGPGGGHIFVHASADPDLSARIVMDIKTGPGDSQVQVGTLLVDGEVSGDWLSEMADALRREGVDLAGCPETAALCAGLPVKEAGWKDTPQAGRLAIRRVDGIEAALAHIERNGGRLVEVIVAEDYDIQQRFLREADAGCVLVNTSPGEGCARLAGLGLPIGISTRKLHAYGPLTLRELTVTKLIVVNPATRPG